MQFDIQVSGSHTEGPEANTRFEKLTSEFINSLRSAGFQVDYAQGRPDTQAPASEVLRRKGANLGLTTEPEPASWQAAVESAMKRAPAIASADLVATSNVDAVSPAALRVAATRGDTSDDPEASAAPTDAALTSNNDSSLALRPNDQTAPQIGASLKANDYTVAELTAAIATEKAGRNRPAVVASLEAACAARTEAIA